MSTRTGSRLLVRWTFLTADVGLGYEPLKDLIDGELTSLAPEAAAFVAEKKS